MKRLVVQQNDVWGWEVREAGAGAELLFTGDRIRSEGYARQVCAREGGKVMVVAATGLVLAEYTVKAWERASYPDPVGEGRSFMRRRRK